MGTVFCAIAGQRRAGWGHGPVGSRAQCRRTGEFLRINKNWELTVPVFRRKALTTAAIQEQRLGRVLPWGAGRGHYNGETGLYHKFMGREPASGFGG